MIYYAHSKLIYNTKRESRELSYLMKRYANNIVDPNKMMGELGSIEPYLNMVRTCNIVVCSEYKEHVGYGVYREIAEAFKFNKDVFVLRKSFLGFKLIRVKRIIIFDPNDWKVYYGKIKI